MYLLPMAMLQVTPQNSNLKQQTFIFLQFLWVIQVCFSWDQGLLQECN